MPVRYYTQNEWTVKENESFALRETLRKYLNHFRHNDEIRLSNKRKDLNGKDVYSKNSLPELDRYPFIHLSFDEINELATALKYIQKRIKRREDNHTTFKFIDAGCGVGWVLCYLGCLTNNIRFYGVELNKENVSVAESVSNNIKQGNILEYDFSKYDFIYYYCPIDNTHLQRKFEERLENTCKVGAIIFPYLKKSDKIRKDNRFKNKYVVIPNYECMGLNKRFYYWEKVKE